MNISVKFWSKIFFLSMYVTKEVKLINLVNLRFSFKDIVFIN